MDNVKKIIFQGCSEPIRAALIFTSHKNPLPEMSHYGLNSLIKSLILNYCSYYE